MISWHSPRRHSTPPVFEECQCRRVEPPTRLNTCCHGPETIASLALFGDLRLEIDIALQTVEALWPALDHALDGRVWTLVTSEAGARRWSALSRPDDCRLHPARILIAGRAVSMRPPDAIYPLVAFGGGAVIDFAKLVASQIAGPAGAAKFPSIIAIPTVVGSGSERTPFASVWTPSGKHSVEHPGLRPEAVILIPALALSVPNDLAAVSALDALSHALEAIWNRNASPASDRFAAAAIPALAHGLDRLAHAKGETNSATIGRLMTGASLAGEAIALTRTAIAHSISYPLTAELRMPHGLASAFTLAEIARFNQSAHARVEVIAHAFECDRREVPDRIERLLRVAGVGAALELPGRAALEAIATQMTGSPRAANNIRTVTEGQARAIAFAAAESLSC